MKANGKRRPISKSSKSAGLRVDLTLEYQKRQHQIPMGSISLSVQERILLFITFVIVLVDIILALSLGFFMPHHYWRTDVSDPAVDILARTCACPLRPDNSTPHDMLDSRENRSDPLANYAAPIRIMPQNPLVRRKRIDNALDMETPHFGNTVIDDLLQHRFLVAFIMPTFDDSTSENDIILVGSGVILSARFVLTSDSCVRDHSEWGRVQVRSGSRYWSKGGQLHSISRTIYVPNYNLVVAQISGGFNLSGAIHLPDDRVWYNAFAFGWDEHMYYRPVGERFKYRSVDIENWIRFQCPAGDARQLCDVSSCCDRIGTHPLITACHSLLGISMVPKFLGQIEADTSFEEKSDFLSFSDKTLVEFLQQFSEDESVLDHSHACSMIFQGNCKVAEVDRCLFDLHSNM